MYRSSGFSFRSSVFYEENCKKTYGVPESLNSLHADALKKVRGHALTNRGRSITLFPTMPLVRAAPFGEIRGGDFYEGSQELGAASRHKAPE